MSETADNLRTELLRLSTADRAELACLLIRSLDEGEDADADVAWEAELERRWHEMASGKVAGEPARVID